MHEGKVLLFHKENLPWLVIFGAPLLYWMMSWQITGPAYLMDEIGYLANAAFLGGHVIDGASSYHAGYSLFLSPLFRFFSNPAYVWRGAMVINAFLWFCSFVLLYRLISDFLPESTVYDKTFALLCTALYPSWAVMSGYVFTTTCFTFVFMCSLSALLLWKGGSVLSLLPHSLCVGFLFWVHPTGGAVCVASFLAVACVCLRERKYFIILVHAAFLLAMVLTYKLGVHKWLAVSMTPEGYQAGSHYRSLDSIFSMLLNIDYWIRFFLLVVGHASSAIVSSFGLAVAGFFSIYSFYDKKSKNLVLISIFMLLSVLFVLLLGAASFSFGKIRIDQLVYSRYLDPTLFPLIVFGILCAIKLRIIFYSIFLFVAFSLIIINCKQYIVDINIIINTISFWPQYLISNINFVVYAIFGSIGIFACYIFKKYRKSALIFMFVALFVVSGYKQTMWHKNILEKHSNPSSILEIIRKNIKFDSHVGFDIESAKKISFFHYERYGLYSFYLFSYKYRRMSSNEWLYECDGPFLTFDIERFKDILSVDIIAREKKSGLYLLFKKQSNKIMMPDSLAREADIDVFPQTNREESFSFCFEMKAFELSRFRQVGHLEEDRLVSDGRRGFLFFGPYKHLDKGRYNIVLNGDFRETAGVVLDVVSNQGNKSHFSSILKKYTYKKSNEITIPFILNENVEDMEIRLFIAKESNISIGGYKIIKK